MDTNFLYISYFIIVEMAAEFKTRIDKCIDLIKSFSAANPNTKEDDVKRTESEIHGCSMYFADLNTAEIEKIS